MRHSPRLSSTFARVMSAARQNAGTDRGWHNTVDRDYDRVAMQVMLMAQHNNQNSR